MSNTMIKFGLIFGAALLIGFSASYIVLGTSTENYAKSEIVGYSVMLLSATAVFFAIRDYRDKRNHGNLSLLQGVAVGTAVSAIASFCFAVFNWVYVTWLQPDFLSEYQAYSEEKIRQSGQSAEVIEKQLAELASFSEIMNSGIGYLALMFLTVFVIGLLFTLVSAVALRSKSE